MPIRTIAIVTLTVLLASPAARSVVQARAEIEPLVDSSTLVVTGRATDIAVSGDGSAIYTYVTIDVASTLKGRASPGRIVIKQLGGVLSDLGLHVDGQARFVVDEDVLLFLSARPRDGTLYTTGLAEGKWSLVRGDVTSLAFQRERLVELDDVRIAAAKSAPVDTPFVAVPREVLFERHQFSFLPSSEGGPARWHEADDGGRITVDYQTVPGSLPGGLAELDAAIGAWNGVRSTLTLARGGSGGAVCPASGFTGNGRVAFYWDDPCGEISDADALTFGVGGGYFTPGFQKTINGTTFNKFLQGLAILNNAGPHLGSASCLQDAATHVLGHAVGLGHSSDGAAVMFPTLRTACPLGASGLDADDITGLLAIYPAIASGGSPPQPPTSMTNTVVLNTVTLNWTAATTGGPAQSYLVDAGSAPGLSNLASLVSNGTATSLTVGAVPAGTYYVRVRARNALGTSGPSPDTTVTVGPCGAPGIPTALAALVGDNNVTLVWSPPSTGVTQGYTLYAGTAPGLSNALVHPLGSVPSFFGVAPFGTYYVRVAAWNSCGASAPTPDVTVDVRACSAAPGAPTGLSFTRSGSAVTLSWTPPAGTNGPARYVLSVGSAPGASNLLVQTSNTNATTFAAVAPNGSYYVRVRSQNACGVSADSNEVQIAIP